MLWQGRAHTGRCTSVFSRPVRTPPAVILGHQFSPPPSSCLSVGVGSILPAAPWRLVAATTPPWPLPFVGGVWEPSSLSPCGLCTVTCFLFPVHLLNPAVPGHHSGSVREEPLPPDPTAGHLSGSEGLSRDPLPPCRTLLHLSRTPWI